MEVIDKASYHIDAGEDKDEVVSKFKIVFKFLKQKKLLSEEGLELFKVGIDVSIVLSENLVNSKGFKFLKEYYDKIINYTSEKINNALKTCYSKFSKEEKKDNAIESFISFCDNMLIAEEFLISPDEKMKWQIKHGEDRKEAKEFEAQAKDAAKSGDYKQAIQYMNQAMNKYKTLKSYANRIPMKNTFAGSKFANGSSTYKGIAKTNALNWCNKMISNCQATILKYQNKARKELKK